MSEEVDAWVRDGERRQRRWLLAGTIALVVAGLAATIIWLLISSNAIPAGDKRAIDTVEANGFRDVLLGGVDVLACADGESSRHFAATNSAGKRVEGTVCCGLSGVGKGCTLRFSR